MHTIGRFLAFVAAGVLIGIGLMTNFSAPLLNRLTPLLGDAALGVSMIVLIVSPALVLAVLKRRFS